MHSNYITPLMTRLLPITTTISSDTVHIARHSVRDLVNQYGTPLYIFDRATIVQACKSYQEAFRTHYHASDVHILYASKAYISPLVARIVAEQGMGLDVVSGGELLVAQRAAFPMERVSFHGNNKLEGELRLALKLGVCISGRYCESGDMLIDEVELPYMQEGDLLLLPTTGAYCLPMASNYNLVPRPGVILVDEQQILTMERRETYDDMLARYCEGR